MLIVKCILPASPDNGHKDTENEFFQDMHDWHVLPWEKLKAEGLYLN